MSYNIIISSRKHLASWQKPLDWLTQSRITRRHCISALPWTYTLAPCEDSSQGSHPKRPSTCIRVFHLRFYVIKLAHCIELLRFVPHSFYLVHAPLRSVRRTSSEASTPRREAPCSADDSSHATTSRKNSHCKAKSLGWRPSLLGWRPLLGWRAIALGLGGQSGHCRHK